ncbi:MAG: hypothetical protein AB7T08_15560 [Hyphomonadaceae bacterium]
MAGPQDAPLLSLDEVARRLGLTGASAARSARRIVHRAGTPYRQVGRRMMLSESDYAALIKALERRSEIPSAARFKVATVPYEPGESARSAKERARATIKRRLESQRRT